MEQALAKIRPHTSSSLIHQKTPATLLLALESTLKEQKAEQSSTAYFAALLTTLDGTLQKRDLGLADADILPAELYLLALVAPFVSTPVIRANLDTLLSLTAPLFPLLNQHAPPLRSQLTLYHVILQSLDRSQLEKDSIRQSFASILQLCLDPRPKVRKKAADIVKDVLSTPPPPLTRHPYASRVAEWVTSVLVNTNVDAVPRPKLSGKAPETSSSETAIHILAFLRPVLLNLPPSSLPAITSLLLTLPRLGNPYLSQSAYSILSNLFSVPAQDGESGPVTDQMSEVLNAVLSSPPPKSDTILSPAWIQVLGSAMVSYNLTNSEACAAELGRVWKKVWAFLESTDSSVRKAAAVSLGLISECFTPNVISSAVNDAEPRSTLSRIISQTAKALDTLAYARAMPELLSVISSLVTNLRYRLGPRGSPTAAECLLLPLIKQVGELRVQKGFEHKEGADSTLAAAMRVIGPQVLLQALPLNLEPADRQTGREPRAYLLPLLSQAHPSPLGHFVSYFVPLSERMFDLQQKAENEGRQSEVKVWSVLVAQIWSGFAGYCWATIDLQQSLTPAFSQLLSQLLYSQPELRPGVLKALKVMIESNVSLSSPADDLTLNWPTVDHISPQEAAQNVEFLRGQAESWLAVLFNVFGSVGRDDRGTVGEVISAWASIAPEQEITKTFANVVSLFRANLANPENGRGGIEYNESGSVTATTQDLLILLLPFLSSSDATALFNLSLSTKVLGGKDSSVQKRGYKILVKVLERGVPSVDINTVLRQLEESADGIAPAAKKDRFKLLSLLIPMIPPSSMHIIPSIIPEAVLGTKEPSEKTRTAAFDLILVMGRKMNEGGVVKRRVMDGMDMDVGDAAATVEEFMTMVAGGLAGASPHMISATVTAISRLVFEFKDIISTQMQTEIFTTLLVFLSSANREIVKSILGFVKLAIHTLSTDLMRPYLKDLVPALLGWSHDHKNHFKAKVRHIFERMLRRFGWDEVYSFAGEDEASKVLVNIKKRKERAKRRRATGRDEDNNGDEVASAKPAAGDAFEDVLYGSESELDDSDDEHRAIPMRKDKDPIYGTRLRADDEEPMDLLQGVASRITNSASDRRRKPGQDATHFKTDRDTNKIIIDDQTKMIDRQGPDVAGTAYRENIISVDGFTRGPNGRVKFNKDTKKRRRDNEDTEDVEMADGEINFGKGRKHKRRSTEKFGQEFKAKKAGGDVKKGGVDPYAYLPLSQAAKMGGQGGRGRAGITRKK